ncbi:MAG: MlaD family protein [Candidatus Cloacimonetes bacterium]|nr:MlaD family protein [Candidatus Cloacimonadota bacterium]
MAHFYKNMKKTELKVGIFVIISLLLLFFSYSWLNDWFLSGRNDTIQVLFDNVSNLEKGSSVYYRGVRVGRVSALRIELDGVIVEMSIIKDTFIDKNAVFLIKDRDVMGTKMVEIFPGDSFDRLNTNDIYRGTSLPGLVDLITRLSELMESMDILLSKIEFNEDFIERIDRIISNTDNSLRGLDVLIGKINDSDIFEVFSDLRNISSRFEDLMNDTSNSLVTTFALMDTLLLNTTVFMDFLHENIAKEESNLHRFLNETELYDNLLNSAKELESLINDVKENPRKYFRITIF